MPPVTQTIPGRGAPGRVAVDALPIAVCAGSTESAGCDFPHPRARMAIGTVALSISLLDRSLAKPELFHFQLQPLARDLQKARGVRDVSVRLLQGPAHELAFEPAH